ncbi:MAG: amidohydrolase family protein, partial [Proteobacteria bacterium]|nr:amidohydrolase family protein [Pseudomonadota bacterium]
MLALRSTPVAATTGESWRCRWNGRLPLGSAAGQVGAVGSGSRSTIRSVSTCVEQNVVNGRCPAARRWLCAVILGLGAAAQVDAGAAADLILTGGRVRTEDPGRPLAEAIAVKDGVIIRVGSASEVAEHRGPDTAVVELAGRVVLPGLADAHVHPVQGEFFHHRLCDVRAFTVAEGFEKLRRCAVSAPAGDWVVGYGWYDLDNAEFDSLTRAQLDALVPDRNMAVVSRDLHTLWVNSRTLAEFGIWRDTPAPAGGQIVRDPATHEPTGMLIDAAAHPVFQRIQYHSPYAAPLRDILRGALHHLNSLGITSILDAAADEETARAYAELDRSGELTARVTLAELVLPDNYRTEIPRIAALRRSLAGRHVAVGFVKVL